MSAEETDLPPGCEGPFRDGCGHYMLAETEHFMTRRIYIKFVPIDEYKAMQRDRRAMKLLRENALKDEANPDLDCYLQSYGPRWHFDHTAIGSDGERSRTFSNDYEDPAEAIIAALGESS